MRRRLRMNKTNKPNSNNIYCRIFKEQIDLINQLPEQERAIVLLEAINHAFNCCVKNQNDFCNQNDYKIQNESAYISVSISNSLSDISKAVLELLKKNIVCREFDLRYGGARAGAGRKNLDNDPAYMAFVELVISCFEPGIKEQEQKEIWYNQQSRYLKEIFKFCKGDAELAIIAINKCFAPLKREDMSYSYRAVVRNISIYCHQATKLIEEGKHIKFTEEQKKILGRINENNIAR